MSNKRVVLLLGALLCLFALTPSSLFAQTASTGTVAGTVTDPSGSAISGASISLTDSATRSERTTTSNDAGIYVFVNIPPGTYNLTVRKTGFRISKFVDQKVIVGTDLTLNVVMELGALSETVEVKVAQGAELQTSNATIGTTVTGDMLLTMPNLNRDATSLLTFQPATAPSVGGGDVYGGQVAGSLSDQNTYMLDGGNFTSDLEGDNNYTHGGMGAIPTPIESIEEFKVATNNQTADFSSSAGGQVMLVTKRGTNTFHGSAYLYYQSQLLNANDWTSNRLLEPKVKYHDNRFGGSVGGPLLPWRVLGGKTYFYAFYEGRRFPGVAQFLEWTVPSALMRQGILQFQDSAGAVHQINLKTSTACNVTATNRRELAIRGHWHQPSYVADVGPRSASQRSDWCRRPPQHRGLPRSLSLPSRITTEHSASTTTLATSGGSLVPINFQGGGPSSNQIDIGGILPGDKLGVPAAVSNNPVDPKYAVLGLTGTLTPNLINEFHLSYLLNDWGWQRQGVTNALSGVPAGLEFADSHFGCLCPLNMDTQDSRKRVWDGHDWTYSDTVSWIKGTSLHAVRR
jgi:hypothetical protein